MLASVTPATQPNTSNVVTDVHAVHESSVFIIAHTLSPQTCDTVLNKYYIDLKEVVSGEIARFSPFTSENMNMCNMNSMYRKIESSFAPKSGNIFA